MVADPKECPHDHILVWGLNRYCLTCESELTPMKRTDDDPALRRTRRRPKGEANRGQEEEKG